MFSGVKLSMGSFVLFIGLHMMSSKHDYANYDKFAPKFNMTYKTIFFQVLCMGLSAYIQNLIRLCCFLSLYNSLVVMQPKKKDDSCTTEAKYEAILDKLEQLCLVRNEDK